MASRTVTVYSFEVMDGGGRSYVPFKATREDISAHYGGQIIEGTGEDVRMSDLDEHGRLRRLATGWDPTNLGQLE